jgi:hypothetical protein
MLFFYNKHLFVCVYVSIYRWTLQGAHLALISEWPKPAAFKLHSTVLACVLHQTNGIGRHWFYYEVYNSPLLN